MLKTPGKVQSNQPNLVTLPAPKHAQMSGYNHRRMWRSEAGWIEQSEIKTKNAERGGGGLNKKIYIKPSGLFVNILLRGIKLQLVKAVQEKRRFQHLE